MTTTVAELAWLKAHPAFEERPATLREFLGPQYLNIDRKVRARLKDELATIMGEEVDAERPTAVPYALITGGIGIGKTTIASIVLPYLVHWTLCLRDPQDFYDLLDGSRIAFMQMSTSEKQALEVVFGDIKARIAYSPWFQRRYLPDPKFKNQLRFPKEVWIIPGDSAETTFEGYNILGGILEEADSHKVSENKDYAEQGFNTIDSRVASRFQDRGFLLVIGQMKTANGFAARKFKEFCERPDAHAVKLAIWESMGWDFYRNKAGELPTFWYDAMRKQLVPSGVAKMLASDTVFEIPMVYKPQFITDPQKALRDLAGIPPNVGDTFIALPERIHEARDRWVARYGDQSPVDVGGRLERWFRAPDTLKRVGHIDIAYSANGDALGFAMGHVREMVEIDGELKPYITIDLLMRMQAPAGSEIFLADVRQFIYALRSDRGFKLETVTMDGFESTDTKQQLERRRFHTEYVSVDKQVLPYHDFREALYERRIEFPPYITRVRRGERFDEVEILVRELENLVDEGKKIEHPPNGSKDVADSVAGVVFTLMGDRRYHRKVTSLPGFKEQKAAAAAGGFHHPALRGDQGLHAPLPPSDWGRYR